MLFPFGLLQDMSIPIPLKYILIYIRLLISNCGFLRVCRMDCLRRIAKGKVDFSVFTAEDLVTATNSQIEVLITNELRFSTGQYLIFKRTNNYFQFFIFILLCHFTQPLHLPEFTHISMATSRELRNPTWVK